MTKNDNIDAIIKTWTYDQEQGGVRMSHGDDGRDIILMRIELGLMQLEVALLLSNLRVTLPTGNTKGKTSFLLIRTMFALLPILIGIA
ncbi:MAG: hypothetical protein NXI22_18080, partial [bacterium]|nr:hypothetical protein [bacterium]